MTLGSILSSYTASDDDCRTAIKAATAKERRDALADWEAMQRRAGVYVVTEGWRAKIDRNVRMLKEA